MNNTAAEDYFDVYSSNRTNQERNKFPNNSDFSMFTMHTNPHTVKKLNRKLDMLSAVGETNFPANNNSVISQVYETNKSTLNEHRN